MSRHNEIHEKDADDGEPAAAAAAAANEAAAAAFALFSCCQRQLRWWLQLIGSQWAPTVRQLLAYDHHHLSAHSNIWPKLQVCYR